MSSAEKRSTRSSTTPGKRSYSEIFSNAPAVTYKKRKITEERVRSEEKQAPKRPARAAHHKAVSVVSASQETDGDGTPPLPSEKRRSLRHETVDVKDIALTPTSANGSQPSTNGYQTAALPGDETPESRWSGRARRRSSKTPELSQETPVARKRKRPSNPSTPDDLITNGLLHRSSTRGKNTTSPLTNGVHKDDEVSSQLDGEVAHHQATPTKGSSLKRNITSALQNGASALTSPSKGLAKATEVLKGILTPSKKRPPGSSRKSVAWTDSQDERSEVIPSSQDHLEDGLTDDEDALVAIDAPEERPFLDGDAALFSSVFEVNFSSLHHQTLNQVAFRDPVPPINLDTECATLHTLITQTIHAGESNSLLVLGGPGSGKNLLVDAVLQDVSRRHSSEPDLDSRGEPPPEQDFHIIRLDGNLLADDKQALKEIWRQLGAQTLTGADRDALLRNEAKKNVADTMASLLALLTHNANANASVSPPESSPKDEEARPVLTSKSIIFILDHFDAFTTHSRQTLLYNLFDVATFHPPGAPAIAVIGLTSVMSVTDLLEKRVKSRFSHRVLFLRSPGSVSEYWERVRQRFLIHPSAKGGDVQSRLRDAAETDEPDEECVHKWNAAFSALYPGNPSFTTLLQRTYAQTTDPRHLLAASLFPLSTLTPTTSLRTLVFPLNAIALPPMMGQDNLHTLHALSTLSLTFLIAAARLTDFHRHPYVTYTSVYREYTALTTALRTSAAISAASGASPGKHSGANGGISGVRLFSKQGARGCFKELIVAELLTSDSAAVLSGGGVGLAGRKGKEGGAGGEGRWRVEVGVEELGVWVLGRERRSLARQKKEGRKSGEMEEVEEMGEDEEGGVENVRRWMVKWCRDI